MAFEKTPRGSYGQQIPGFAKPLIKLMNPLMVMLGRRGPAKDSGTLVLTTTGAKTGRERGYIAALSAFYKPGPEKYQQRADLYSAAMRDLHAGITYINPPTIGAEVHLPFGGVKQTGNGHREGGTGAIDFYTTWKSVYVDYSDKLQRAQIDVAE